MTPHFLYVSSAEADRTVLAATNGKNQAMRRSIDQAISPISRLAVVETIIGDDRLNFEVDPARATRRVSID